ncbi:MAG: hypothetical protein KKD73_10375 [Proteobacteria bacterium]|nr:hypothetical protein [Pseudomonadota bacterium]MBU1639579.1 hypothetical protein [Pseudomonadota bacterium]
MLGNKEGTFAAKLRLSPLLAFLATPLRIFCSPQVAAGAFFALVVLEASPAMAVQVHGPPEGYYVHQMAHLFFTVALVFMLAFLHARPLGKGKAWHYFKLSLFFFLLWNLWTFTAHLLAHHLPPEAFATEGRLWTHRFNVQLSVSSLLYYITRFDHLLCLPGIWFLLQSLKTFCLEITQDAKKKEADHE